MLDRRGKIGDVRSDEMHLSISSGELGNTPVLVTTSGLGDEHVEGPRRALFRQMFTPGVDWVEQQDRFHRHRWLERPALSVCMSRAEARTVSLTVIELDAE